MSHRIFASVLMLAYVLKMSGGTSPSLSWDKLSLDYHAVRGETNTVVHFRYTNASSSEIIVRAIKASCHCTVPRDFLVPRTISPGEVGQLPIEVDINLKWGTLHKTITVETSGGTNVLTLQLHLPQPDQREQNRIAAFVDRQAVFKGDCAQCHATPAQNLRGEKLYGAVCAICHDGEHRAEMVPDLAQLTTPASALYWQQWITVGKPGSFMPGFHQRYGGPLSDEQIKSLVEFLSNRFSQRNLVAGKPILPLD